MKSLDTLINIYDNNSLIVRDLKWNHETTNNHGHENNDNSLLKQSNYMIIIKHFDEHKKYLFPEYFALFFVCFFFSVEIQQKNMKTNFVV